MDQTQAPVQETDESLVDQIVEAILSLTQEEQDAIYEKLEAALGEGEEETSEETQEQPPEVTEAQKQEYAAKLAM